MLVDFMGQPGSPLVTDGSNTDLDASVKAFLLVISVHHPSTVSKADHPSCVGLSPNPSAALKAKSEFPWTRRSSACRLG